MGNTKVAVNPITGATTFNSLVGTIVPGSGNPVDGMHIDGLTGKGDFYSFTPLVLAPRLGFAYDPFGDGKTAIRASSGIFYNRTFASVPGSGALTTATAGGADLIELGVPFSDPIADGPVIQRGSDRALKAGTTVARVLDIARCIRARSRS